MTNQPQLSEKWIKASILGTVWASSEIVLGSFLHNLRIPFSGNILTAIALVILISASYKWKENGLFWRAGVICALLKTMSPSAVIFGPMVAIIAEALLLEFSVRLFGRTILGFVLGSILAMSWVLFQKIANFIIFYGYNIVELYESLMQYAEKELSLKFDAVWMPILLLLAVYAIFGVFSAIIGIRTGRKLNSNSHEDFVPISKQKTDRSNRNSKEEFNYSIAWLVLDVLFIVGTLLLLNFLPFFMWACLVIIVVTLWAFRYKRALRQLVRPKFWIFFIVITMFTAFVFTKVQSSSNSVMDGLLIGLEMNFRAIILIMGFSVLGNELYNPRIRNFFMKSYFKQLPLAMELSLESLPGMVSSIPDFKTLVKNPVSVIYQVMSQAENRLNEITSEKSSMQRVFILTGAVGEGKTSQVQKIISKLQDRMINVGGIYSPRIMENEKTIGYDIVNIQTNVRMPFLRILENEDLQRIGKYCIQPDGLEAGLSSIKKSRTDKAEVIIIDEVGRLELRDKGWAPEIEQLLNKPESSILMAVRKDFVEDLIQKWKIENYVVSNISELDLDKFCEKLKIGTAKNAKTR